MNSNFDKEHEVYYMLCDILIENRNIRDENSLKAHLKDIDFQHPVTEYDTSLAISWVSQFNQAYKKDSSDFLRSTSNNTPPINWDEYLKENEDEGLKPEETLLVQSLIRDLKKIRNISNDQQLSLQIKDTSFKNTKSSFGLKLAISWMSQFPKDYNKNSLMIIDLSKKLNTNLRMIVEVTADEYLEILSKYKDATPRQFKDWMDTYYPLGSTYRQRK